MLQCAIIKSGEDERVCVHLSLGSNLNNRLKNMHTALNLLEAHTQITVRAVSGCYETAPWGVVDQPAFLNLAAEIWTDLEPMELLNVVKQIEIRVGRQATRRWGPRVVDIDLVLWGGRMVSTPQLTIPHKDFRERMFVLRPLAEIAPDALDPKTGLTVSQLLAQSPDSGKIELL